MSRNDFLPFAVSGSANVATQSEYDGSNEQQNGMQPGMASSRLCNKAWRQAALMAAALGSVIAGLGGEARDDGDVEALQTAISDAIKSLASTVNITGSAATCNGCGEVNTLQLTLENDASNRKSGFYQTNSSGNTDSTVGLSYAGVIQVVRHSAHYLRLILKGNATSDPQMFAQGGSDGSWRAAREVAFLDSNITGNAASATKLATPRTINGQAFDGTENITVPEYAAMSKSTAGYIKFRSSGIIFQWIRSAQVNENSTTNVTFPVAFPSACAICVGGVAEYVSTVASQVAVTTWTKTNCTVRSGAGGGGQMRSATIIAIGY